MISASTLMPDLPDLVKQLANAFSLPLNEAVIRIFQNPLGAPAPVQDWSVY